MLNYFCIVVFCITAVLSAEDDGVADGSNATRVLRAHLGERMRTDPFRGQLSTIRDARSLDCTFPQLELCCWYNQPKPLDDLDWVLVKTTVEPVRFRRFYGGKTASLPNPPYLVTTAASQSSSERAMLVSCAIPCQSGAGELTVQHWLDDVELNICRMRVNSQTVVEPCANIKGTSTSTVMVEELPEPFYIVIMATGFGKNGVAVIDNLKYSARIPPKC